MKNTGTLRIQTFAARQSAPMEGVTVAVQGDGFTLHCITDATGSAADIPIEAPSCALSLDEDNTTRPYAIVTSRLNSLPMSGRLRFVIFRMR